MTKLAYKVKVIKQFQRSAMNELITVKKGAVIPATYHVPTDMWRVAFKSRWLNLGDSSIAMEYLEIVQGDSSGKYHSVKEASNDA